MSTQKPGWNYANGLPIVKIFIREEATGIVRSFEETSYFFDDEENASDFLWSEGNQACDCNRHTSFKWAGGEAPDENRPCGNDAYSLNLQNPFNGEFFYTEFEPVATQPKEQ